MTTACVLAIDYLAVDEVDAEGRSFELVLFDPQDLAAAYAELDARFDAGEGAAHPAAVAWPRDFSAAFARRDWDAVAAIYSPSTVGHDHRLVSWGTLDGRESFLQSMRQMVELAPDARMRTDHARTSSRGMLAACMWTGTREGGAFESPFVLVVELDAHGRAVRSDFYDPHHVDRALARFEEICASERLDSLAVATGNAATAGLAELRPDPLRIPPNAATRVLERWQAAVAAGDEEAVRAFYDSSYRLEDRRRLFRMTIDADAAVASDRHTFQGGWRPVRTLLATAGDRLALYRVVWATGEADGISEVELLALDEVDRQGRFVWGALFDPDDRAAASRELFERYAANGADGETRTGPG